MKYAPLIAILICYIIRRHKIHPSLRYLVFSMCIVLSAVPIISIVEVSKELPGEFGKIAYLYPATVFAFINLCKPLCKKVWVFNVGFLGLILFLFANIYSYGSHFRVGILPPLLEIGQLVLFFYTIRTRYTLPKINEALFQTFFCWTILEGFLTLCYPVLGIEKFAGLFSSVAEEWSLRRENYASAVGTFPHPSQLAYMCAAFALYYFVCYLDDYKRNVAKYLMVINVLIIFFTYSRTTYVALFICLACVYVLFKQRTISIKYLGYFIVFLLLSYLATFIPVINNLFFHSDSNDMIDARMVHWLIGFDIWHEYPLLGCGINSHVRYMQQNLSLLYNDFIVTNPIHNVHIIVLVETGIIGILYWSFWQCKLIYVGYRTQLMKDSVQRSMGLLMVSLTLFTFIYGFFGWSIFNMTVYTPFLMIYILFYKNK